MADVTALLNQISGIVWGPVTLALMLGVGLFLTIRLKFMSILRIPDGLPAWLFPAAMPRKATKATSPRFRR